MICRKMQSFTTTELVEKICELDDDLIMMEYLEGEEPSVEAMKNSFKKSNL